MFFNLPWGRPISPAKAELLEEIKKAVEYLNAVKQGKMKAQPTKELLDEP